MLIFNTLLFLYLFFNYLIEFLSLRDRKDNHFLPASGKMNYICLIMVERHFLFILAAVIGIILDFLSKTLNQTCTK